MPVPAAPLPALPEPKVVSYEEISELLESSSFLTKLAMSMVDTYTYKANWYEKRERELEEREDALRERIRAQSEEFDSLPEDVRRSGSADTAQISQLQALLQEKVLYVTMQDYIREAFDDLVKDQDLLVELRTVEGAERKVRRALRSGAIKRKQLELVEAVTLVESNIRGDTRRHIREHLYTLLKTFAYNPRGMLNSLQFNFLLMGRAGVGKTQIAFTMARFFHAVGILITGQLHPLTKSSFIAGFLGQSAAKTRAALYSSLEGVAFLDEAYALLSCEYSQPDNKRAPGDTGEPAERTVTKRDAYGMDAVDTLTEMLTDLKGMLCFIAAGYEEEMMTCFLGANSGLNRRFPTKWTLGRFSLKDLLDLLHTQLLNIDRSGNFWFQNRQLFESDEPGRRSQDMVASAAPFIGALDQMDALTSQAGDIETLAHSFYNLAAVTPAKRLENTPAIGAVNEFLAITKRQPFMRIVRLSSDGSLVYLLDAEGKRQALPSYPPPRVGS